MPEKLPVQEQMDDEQGSNRNRSTSKLMIAPMPSAVAPKRQIPRFRTGRALLSGINYLVSCKNINDADGQSLYFEFM
jgi:hypothetical protein